MINLGFNILATLCLVAGVTTKIRSFGLLPLVTCTALTVMWAFLIPISCCLMVGDAVQHKLGFMSFAYIFFCVVMASVNLGLGYCALAILRGLRNEVKDFIELAFFVRS